MVDSKLKKVLNQAFNNKYDGAYPGTVLDFLLDRLATNIDLPTIQAQFREIWGTNITEDQIIQILKGHESELPERRKQAADTIKQYNYYSWIHKIAKELYEDAQNAKNARDKVIYLGALYNYLMVFLKRTEIKELNIKTETSPDSIIAILEKSLLESQNTPNQEIQENQETITETSDSQNETASEEATTEEESNQEEESEVKNKSESSTDDNIQNKEEKE